MGRTHDTVISNFDLDRLESQLEHAERERDELKQQIKQVREQYRLSSVCRKLKAENEQLKQQQQ